MGIVNFVRALGVESIMTFVEAHEEIGLKLRACWLFLYTAYARSSTTRPVCRVIAVVKSHGEFFFS